MNHFVRWLKAVWYYDPDWRKPFNRGRAAIEKGDYDQAIVEYDAAIRVNPNVGEAFFNRAVSYSRKKDWGRAVSDYTSAIKLKQNAFSSRGYAHIQLGRYTLALEDFAEAIRREPALARLYVNRAWLLEQKNDVSGAISDLSEAIRLEPQVASHHTIRAHYRHSCGDYAGALADDYEAIRLDPNHVRAHNGVAWILATCPEDNCRNGEEALQHALKAVELGEGENLAYTGTLAAAYAEAGNYEAAILLAKKFLDSNPPEENIEPARLRLRLYEQGKPYREERGKLETVRARG
jgi:tetratricopeptide (TPR) repeat protein